MLHRTILLVAILSVWYGIGLADQNGSVAIEQLNDQLKLYSPVLIDKTNPVVQLDPDEFQQRGTSYTLWCGSKQSSFWAAFRFCLNITQQLASDESTQDSKLLTKLFLDNKNKIGRKSVWLGGTDMGKRGSWIWLAELRPVGGFTRYFRWSENEPRMASTKGACMAAKLEKNEVRWFAQDCDVDNCFVCQKYLT